jgi:hypothetical protein
MATAPVDLAPFRAHALMSWTSASRTRMYYLNAGSEVRFIAPDGSGGIATRITLGANEQAGFAVSPDDQRIAVSILSYTPPPVAYSGMRLYVEDVQGGGHHVDLFSSSSLAEFPVGWTGARLVMAVGPPTCCQNMTLNPYGATSYHVVDAFNGNRVASICSAGHDPNGPAAGVGTICNGGAGGAPGFYYWDGSPIPAPAAMTSPFPYLAALSPDGTRIALGGDPEMKIEGPLGNFSSIAESGYVYGWLDLNHVVVQRQLGGTLSVLDLGSYDLSTKWAPETSMTAGGFMGTFPPAIS